MRGPRILPYFRIGQGGSKSSPMSEQLRAELKRINDEFARPKATLPPEKKDNADEQAEENNGR